MSYPRHCQGQRPLPRSSHASLPLAGRRGSDRGWTVRRRRSGGRGVDVGRSHPAQQEDEEDDADPEPSQDLGPKALSDFQNPPRLLCSRGNFFPGV